MESKPKNREWVKNAAIILLAILLVLTFFSNTWRNHNLPEVATANVSGGPIVAKVRGSGTVISAGSYQVVAQRTQEIRAVMVRAGQEVETGDVLFVLGDGDSAELEAAQDQLRQLQMSYQRSALGGSAPDYSGDERRLAGLAEDYNDALAAYNAAVEEYNRRMNDTSASAQIASKQAALKQTQKDLDEATRVRDAYKEAYDTLVSQAADELSAKEQERLTARQSVLSYYEEHNTLPMPTEEELADPATTLSELKESGDAPQELLDIWKSYADADEAVEDANLALSQISSDSLDTAQDKVDTLTGQIDSLQAEIDKLIATFGSAGLQAALEAKNAAKDALDTAEDAYLTAEQALNDKMAADNKSAALLGLDLADLQAQIQKQKNLIAELSGGEDNQIVANVSGTVQSVEVTAGSKPQKDTVLCTIDVPDQGYTLSFSVSNDQARRLRPGDTATVTNYYWGSQIVATLESIKTDPKNPQTNKLLTFTLEGDVSAGSQLTISVGSRSASYDSIVPNSAIRSDANGSFVFKVEAKNSPLGNRYIARRVSVEVLASDDTNSAVTGDFGWGDYVITTSSAPIQNGDLVRLAD